MKILIDMNLSPDWERILQNAGHQAAHWSRIGPANAPDHELLRWARENQFIVFTYDLDFGAILAASKANSPSVLQVRTQDISPECLQSLILKSLDQFNHQLKQGVLISIDEQKTRARILPIQMGKD